VSNRKKLKPQPDRSSPFSALAADELELSGVEVVVDIALAVVHEVVLVQGYQRTAEQVGTLLALAQTVGL